MVRVAIIEDTDEIREGLAILINGSVGFRCAAAYRNGEDALIGIPKIKPRVVLMDIGLPGISGIECTKRLKQIVPDQLIMMLTVFENDDLIFEALKAGATGYVLKKTPPDKLMLAIQDLHNGGSPMSNQIARKVVSAFQAKNSAAADNASLSKREQEILSFLAKGYRYQEIADTLFISIETVRTHLRNVYEKLQVRSGNEAILKVYPRQ